MSDFLSGGPSVCAIDPSAGAGRPLRVLVVDDDPATLRMLEVDVSRYGFEVETAEDGAVALAALRERPAPIVLSDWRMPKMTGLELCAAIRNDDSLGFVYFLMLTARDDEASLGRAFEAGADDFIVKPVRPIGLRARLTAARRIADMNRRLELQNQLSRRHNAELERMTGRLEHAALHDELTGLFNRQAMRDRVGRLWREQTPAGYPTVSCAICDIDRFKSINDTKGHHVGDAAIRRAATAIAESMPASAFTARLGGDEFVVFDTASSPQELAEAMREASAWLADPTREPVELIDFPIRLSAGVACTCAEAQTDADLLRIADETLYEVKQSGRGHVRVRGDEPAAKAA